MKPAISVRGVSKRFRLGTGGHRSYRTLRESLTAGARAAGRWAARPFRRPAPTAPADEPWAVKDAGFAVAAHLEPEVLLVDEVLAVGDTAFQRKCLGKMGQVSRQGRTILFVSHNMTAVKSLCTRAVLFEGGRLAIDGDVDVVVDRYLTGGRAT